MAGQNVGSVSRMNGTRLVSVAGALGVAGAMTGAADRQLAIMAARR